jgi:hypothetical protein
VSARKGVTYTTVASEANAELASVREAAVRQPIADDVAAILRRMEDAEAEALAVWVASDEMEDDESIHALGSLQRLMHLRGVWGRAREDYRGALWRGEATAPEPARPAVFSVAGDLEAGARFGPFV